MIIIEKEYKKYKINIKGMWIGEDLNIMISGGEKPHIGAVALGIPVKSLSNSEKISGTVSVVTVPGHKEDVLAQNAAKKITKEINRVTVVTCGIHFDGLEMREIEEINTLTEKLVEDFIEKIKNNKIFI